MRAKRDAAGAHLRTKLGGDEGYGKHDDGRATAARGGGELELGDEEMRLGIYSRGGATALEGWSGYGAWRSGGVRGVEEVGACARKGRRFRSRACVRAGGRGWRNRMTGGSRLPASAGGERAGLRCWAGATGQAGVGSWAGKTQSGPWADMVLVEGGFYWDTKNMTPCLVTPHMVHDEEKPARGQGVGEGPREERLVLCPSMERSAC
uniref:Uncharacterized protein n=1 Tax=Setaria viridis TaxID=4556 RepID=A0A4U6TJU9_SETVI|nr:LOW QUALITY PROTEIN: hypothetical protein SEVIR_8G259300v2 [Setaria viridis]